MTQNSTIQEALKRINSHDWLWMMADYGYVRNYNAAKADMREFVKLIATIEDKEVRESLKALWMLRHEEARNSINGRKTENYEARKAKLMTAIAA
jgi:hypothetical protein